MNTDLLNVVKEAVATRGESILSEPKVVSAFLSDLAQDVPKTQKNALIKCLEHKFAQILQNVNKAERANCKQKLAEKLSDEEGLKIDLCQDTIELLGTILFGEENPPAIVVPPVKVAPPAVKVANTNDTITNDAASVKVANNKTSKQKNSVLEQLKNLATKFNPIKGKFEMFSVRCVQDHPSAKVATAKKRKLLYIFFILAILAISSAIYITFIKPMLYSTIKIDDAVWMAEDLENGRLYDWRTAETACPVGWHLPANSEFKTLNKYKVENIFTDEAGVGWWSTNAIYWHWYNGGVIIKPSGWDALRKVRCIKN